jgi:hypothetical protein
LDADSHAAKLDEIADRTADRYPQLAAELRQIARGVRSGGQEADDHRDGRDASSSALRRRLG